ncbi:MAG: hypothetical protein J6H31_05795 [Butyrivibrio sp.]|nr:hypothetical protein [Butyrivibrio sp.]
MKKRTEINEKKHYFTNTNNRILAENSEDRSGFDIWLNLSGERHYLMHHRHNAMIYVLLKDGISLGELARWKPENASIVIRYFGGLSIRQIDKMTNSVANVLKTAKAYLANMPETVRTEQKARSNAEVSLVKTRRHNLVPIDRESAA